MDIVKELYLFRVFARGGDPYTSVAKMHYVFETDSAYVFVLEPMTMYSTLNEFIFFSKNLMHLRIFVIFCILMFARELSTLSIFCGELTRMDFYFHPQNDFCTFKCLSPINFKSIPNNKPEDYITRIKSYRSLVGFINQLFKIDNVYEDEENEVIRSEVRSFLSQLNNMNDQEPQLILEQFADIVNKYRIQEKIIEEFVNYNKNLQQSENLLKVGYYQFKHTSMLNTSLKSKTFDNTNTGKLGSRTSIPDICRLLNNNILGERGKGDRGFIAMLGMNRVETNKNLNPRKSIMVQEIAKKRRISKVSYRRDDDESEPYAHEEYEEVMLEEEEKMSSHSSKGKKKQGFLRPNRTVGDHRKNSNRSDMSDSVSKDEHNKSNDPHPVRLEPLDALPRQRFTVQRGAKAPGNNW